MNAFEPPSCAICYNWFNSSRDAHLTCENGHLCCMDCIASLLGNEFSRCPTCAAPLLQCFVKIPSIGSYGDDALRLFESFQEHGDEIRTNTEIVRQELERLTSEYNQMGIRKASAQQRVTEMFEQEAELRDQYESILERIRLLSETRATVGASLSDLIGSTVTNLGNGRARVIRNGRAYDVAIEDLSL